MSEANKVAVIEPTADGLLDIVAQKLGRLQVSHDWLVMQLEAVTAKLENAAIEKAEWEHEREGREQERQILFEKLHALTPSTPPTGKTPRATAKKN